MSSGTDGSPPEARQFTLDLLMAIADARDEDVRSLPPLAAAFDPEALARFIGSTTVPTEITLEVYECRVEIDAEGNVTATHNDTTE